MTKTPLFPGDTVGDDDWESCLHAWLSPWPHMVGANVSTRSPGARAPGVDSCFLWLNTQLDSICLNTESLSPHPCIAHVLPLLPSAAWGLANTRESALGSICDLKSIKPWKRQCFITSGPFIFLEESCLSSLSAPGATGKDTEKEIYDFEGGTNEIVAVDV